jgi:hypothetical protein
MTAGMSLGIALFVVFLGLVLRAVVRSDEFRDWRAKRRATRRSRGED